MEPMTMMAILSAAQGVGGLLQKGQSAALRRKAKRNFQPYTIPSSQKAMLGISRSLATQRGIPGEDIYRSQAQASVARGVEAAQRTAESPNDVLSVLGRLYGGYQGFEQNLAIQGGQAYERRQKDLMGALNQFSQFEAQRWQMNELYPYMQAMGEAGQVDEAGNVNLQSAITSGMNIYGAQADINQQNTMFDKWMDWKLGPNMGEQWGRTRGSEYGLRNLSQPNVNTGLNIDRAPLLPWVNPNR